MSLDSAPFFDSAQLDQRSMGDESLRRELLVLFTAEVERLVRQAEDAPNAGTRDDRLRAISASARVVGAMRLVETAELIEAQFTAREFDLTPLREVVAETLASLRQIGA